MKGGSFDFENHCEGIIRGSMFIFSAFFVHCVRSGNVIDAHVYTGIFMLVSSVPLILHSLSRYKSESVSMTGSFTCIKLPTVRAIETTAEVQYSAAKGTGC